MVAVTYEPGNMGDDEYERLGLAEAELFANEPFNDIELSGGEPRLSYTDWEKRARDVQPGRGYEMADMGRASHFLGDVATTGFDREQFHTAYGMPTVRTRRALSKLFIPRINR